MYFFGTNYSKIVLIFIATEGVDYGDIVTTSGKLLEILFSKNILRSTGKRKHRQNAGTLNLVIGISAQNQHQANNKQKADTSTRT